MEKLSSDRRLFLRLNIMNMVLDRLLRVRKNIIVIINSKKIPIFTPNY